MATREELHARLFRKLADLVGADEAALMMSPFPWDQVATKADLAELRGELRAEMHQLRAELRGEMHQMRGELTEKIVSQKWTLLAGYFVGTATIAGAVVAAIRL